MKAHGRCVPIEFGVNNEKESDVFKKFMHGFVFGSGFAIAFVVITYTGFAMIIPTMFNATSEAPAFKDAKTAKVIEQESSPAPAPTTSDAEFTLFKNSHAKMQVPADGGILAIATVNAPSGSQYPATYQLWITESEFWQVKTTEQQVEIEKLAYPTVLPIDAVNATMRKQAGYASSTMTVNSEEVASLKMGQGSWHDQNMNGKMKITEGGVVFFQPDKR